MTRKPALSVLFSRLSQVAENHRQAILIIFLVAMALRVGFALTLPARVLWPDGERYEKVAMNLITDREFGSLKDNYRSVPTQPLLIAAVYAVFGKNYVALRLLFAVIGAVTCGLAYMLAKKLANPTVGLLTGLVLACYPHYIYISTLFEYPQAFFIFAMTLCFLGLLAFEESYRQWALFFAGLCFGVALLSAPTVLLFLPFVFLWLALKLFPQARLITSCFVLLLGVLLPVAPWAMRNYLAYGHVIIVNVAGGINFWVANNETYVTDGKAAVILGCWESYADSRFCKEYVGARRRTKSLGPVESIFATERIAWQQGFAFIQQDPGRFMKLAVLKFFDFWSPYPDAAYKKEGQYTTTRTFISFITYGSLLLIAIPGACLTLPHWRRFILVYSYIGAFTLAHMIFLPSLRYRLPLDLFLAFFAAYALDRVLRTRDPDNHPFGV